MDAQIAPLPSRPEPTTSVGIDMVALDEVAASLDAWGSRYVQRLFSATEQAQWPAGPSTIALCALGFAAKEAAIKALGLADGGVDWRDIQVDLGRWPAIGLSLLGRAGELTARGGYSDWQVTASLGGGQALACVCARRSGGSTSSEVTDPQPFQDI